MDGALHLLLFDDQVVFLARLAGRHGQLLLMRGDDVGDVFRAVAGEHRVAPPLAAAAALAFQRVGPAAHAQPYLILHAGIPHRVLAGHKAQLIQRAAPRQGVGIIVCQGRVAPAPDGGIVEPDLLDHQIDALHVAPLGRQQHDAEPLAHPGLEALDALRLRKEEHVLLVKAFEGHLDGHHHLVAEVVHDKGAVGVVLGGHGILPELDRTGEINLHAHTSQHRGHRVRRLSEVESTHSFSAPFSNTSCRT